MGATWIGYDRQRVATLRDRVHAALDELRSWRSEDPSAAVAGAAVRIAREHLENAWLPLLDRVLASDAMTAPLATVPQDPDELLRFLQDSDLGRLVFGVIDAAHQGDLDEADGNWSTDDVEAAGDLDHVRSLLADLDLTVEARDALARAVVATATTLDDGERAWEEIDDEVGWYERGPVGSVLGLAADVWDRASTYLQHIAESAERMASDPVQTARDVVTGTVVVEQLAAAEAILVEDGELYLDGACGTAATCITGARPLPGAAATTFGHTIVLADDDAPSSEVIDHELQHVADIEMVGATAFYSTYLTNYLWGWGWELDDVLRGEPVDQAHDDAYEQVVWEQRARD